MFVAELPLESVEVARYMGWTCKYMGSGTWLIYVLDYSARKAVERTLGFELSWVEQR
jgi:hypothetical protein